MIRTFVRIVSILLPIALAVWIQTEIDGLKGVCVGFLGSAVSTALYLLYHPEEEP